MPIKVVRYCSPNPGPHLTVLGAVHGNECCGAMAIEEILAQVENGEIPILQGSVTFIPVVNKLAYERGVRFIDHDLSHSLRRTENPTDYEDVIGNFLCPILEESDVLLDIHSYSVFGPAFVFSGTSNEEEIIFRRILGPDIEISGWQEAHAERAKLTGNDFSVSVADYARNFGAIAATIECGEHNDPGSVDVAVRAIRNALDYCRICPANGFKTKLKPPRMSLRLTDVFTRGENFRPARENEHVFQVSKDETIAYKGDGSPIKAPNDGFVLIPDMNCKAGNDWMFFGVPEKLAS